MNKLKLILASCVIAVAACAGTPLLDQETVALKSVTLARQASAAKLRAGKISVETEEKNKTYFDALAQAIKDAVAANDSAAIAANKDAADKAAAALKAD